MSDDHTKDPPDEAKNIIDFFSEKNKRKPNEYDEEEINYEYFFNIDLYEEALDDREWLLFKNIKKEIIASRSIICSQIKKLETLTIVVLFCMLLQITILFLILSSNLI